MFILVCKWLMRLHNLQVLDNNFQVLMWNIKIMGSQNRFLKSDFNVADGLNDS